MRILHTADWHLGKMFYGDYLTDEQAYVLTTQFLPLLREERVDAVLLSGDVYDRSLPPTGAVELFDEIATKVTAELGIPFLVISGNHDSASRLSFGSTLLAKQGLFITGELEKMNGLILLEDAYGPIAFIAVPFAEPAVVRHYLKDDTIHTYEDALQAMLAIQGNTTAARKVCLAHAFVAGSLASDSERPLSIGGSDAVSADLFADYTYTALGHLHGPQQAGNPNVRYAGSLLKYSFGEARQKKGAVLVDIDGNGNVDTTFIPFVPRHDVRIIEGLFADIMQDTSSAGKEDYVLVRLADTEPILDGMAKLRQKYPRAMALETPNRQHTAAAERSFHWKQTTESQLFESFAKAMQGERPLDAREQQYMDELWNTLRQREGDSLL